MTAFPEKNWKRHGLGMVWYGILGFNVPLDTRMA